MKALLPLVLMLATAPAAWAQLLISELLYQPRSGEAEYVELYNAGSGTVNLSDYQIVRWVADSMGRHYVLPSLQVEAGAYVVLSGDVGSVMANYRVAYPSRLVECTLPPYPNAGGSVVLVYAANDEVADRFDYLPSMHSPLLRDKAGVALERRSFSLPADAAGNWMSASSTASYGTPTAPNSQSSERLALETDFRLSAEVVSPDGDGYQDLLTLTYETHLAPLMADVRVMAADGRECRRLLNRALLGSSGELEWDGCDQSGHRLPPGRYLIHILLYDLHGTAQTLRRTVAVY